jgi:hypothetical protein
VWLDAQQVGLSLRQGDRLQRFASAGHARVVALVQELVQGAVLEVARKEAREARLGQEHLLQEERLAVGHPEALEVDHGGSDRDVERLGDGGVGGDGPGGHDARGGVVAELLHLFGERHGAVEVEVDRRTGDERAASAGALEAPLAGQVAQRPAHGDQAAAVSLRQLALRRQPVARAPLAGVDRGAQVKIDLVVERDRSRQEPEACHARRE